MVDNFSIAVSHFLLALMLWKLFNNPALEEDGAVAKPRSKAGFAKFKRGGVEQDGDADA